MATSRYTTRFTFTASASVAAPTEEEQMVARASLDKLKPLLPGDIDPESDQTIVYAAGNLAVANTVNLNDDALSTEDAIRVHRGFEHQQVNIEHGRGNVVGFIVRAGLSELGTDRLITPEEARAGGKPFNIAIVIGFWRVVDSDLCNFIIQSSAPGNPDKGKLSLSFEVGFDDYDVVVLPHGVSNLSMASRVITPDAPEFDRYDKVLRVNGGKGSFGKENARVARILSGNIVPLGAGVVTVPAAAVKGITAITENPHAAQEADVAASVADAGLYKYSSTQCTLTTADAAPLLAFAESIPDDCVYMDPKDPTLGRETEIHCTACYGLTTTDPAAVQAALAGVGSIHMCLGAVSTFEHDESPYSVLKIDVESEDLHRVHALIKASTKVVSKWPDFHPHVTLLYAKKGTTAPYIGDTRFAGRELVFNSITFSPHEGDRVELPLAMVYSNSDPTMATASRYIKLSEGWQARLQEIRAAATLPTGGDPLVNGVNITLSDGRKIMGVKVFDGETLQLDKELSMSGVVITDMTPGAAPQADDTAILHPAKADIAPVTSPEQQARDAEAERLRHVGQMAAYTDAAVTNIMRVAASVSSLITASVSPATTPSNMKLEDLKQSIANVKSVEELPAVTANVALFVEEIAKESVKQSEARKLAETAAADAVKSAEEIRAQLATLQKQHDQIRAEQASAAAEAAYQERMATIDEVFVLEDEVKAEIIEEVKACVDAPAFEKWLARAKKMMKEKTKDFQKKKKDDECAAGAVETEEQKAAKAAAVAFASAGKTIVDPKIPNEPIDAKTLKDRYAEAFAGGISIAGMKITELNKLPVKAVK